METLWAEFALRWIAVVSVGIDWPLALLAALATGVGSPCWSRSSGDRAGNGIGLGADHRERRRAPVSGRREAREALALVGDASRRPITRAR